MENPANRHQHLTGQNRTMSFIAINVIAIPEGHGQQLEDRFAKRAGMVEHAAGFERFELLRPTSGTTDYLVVTHWKSEADFQAWQDSQDFRSGHASARSEAGSPSAATANLWTFTVAQEANPATR